VLLPEKGRAQPSCCSQRRTRADARGIQGVDREAARNACRQLDMAEAPSAPCRSSKTSICDTRLPSSRARAISYDRASLLFRPRIFCTRRSHRFLNSIHGLRKQASAPTTWPPELRSIARPLLWPVSHQPPRYRHESRSQEDEIESESNCYELARIGWPRRLMIPICRDTRSRCRSFVDVDRNVTRLWLTLACA